MPVNNGHYYEYFHQGLSFASALADASGRTFGQLPGHLATITSSIESQFLSRAFSNPKGWFGGNDLAMEGISFW